MTDWNRLAQDLAPWIPDAAAPLPELLPLRACCVASDADELQDVVRVAAAAGAPVYALGGQTALDYGHNATKEGIAVATGAMDRVVDYPARDMTVTVEAGITFDQLAELLAEEDQCLPLDVPDSDRATLGGIVATNVSGPRRYGYGTLRDYLIGVSAVDASGTLFKAGGRVVKNVAGYDLCKLLVGSLGTLATITQLTLKVRPLPQARAIVWAPCGSDLAVVEQTLDRLGGSATRPVCIDLLNRAAGEVIVRAAGADLPTADYVLAAGFEGSEKTVTWQQKKVLDELGAVSSGASPCAALVCQPLLKALSEFAASPSGLTFKATLPASKVCEFFHQSAQQGMVLQSHAGNGIVTGRLPDEVTDGAEAESLLRPLREAAVHNGGNLVVLRCPAAWKEHLAVWGKPRGDWELMRAIKRKLDPGNLLNPGRFIDGR